MSSPNLQEFEALLGQMLQPNTEVPKYSFPFYFAPISSKPFSFGSHTLKIIKQAVEVLNKQLKQSLSMLLLLELLAKSQHAEVNSINPLLIYIVKIRQLSAVLMRKKIVGHWGKLKEDVQQTFKTTLLDVLVKDPKWVFL